MSGLSVRSRVRACALILSALGMAFGILLPTAALANSGITINDGGCSGGGFEFCYAPESATASSGSPVTWTNASSAGHTATSCTPGVCAGAPSNTGSDTFAVNVDTTGSFTFHSPGTYVYYCSIHGYAAMHGTITVSAASTPTPAPTPTPTAATSARPAPTPTSSVASVTTPSAGAAASFSVAAILLVVAVLLAAGSAAVLIRRRTR